MNFIDTLKSVDLVLSTNEVPLVVGESGIGKTALAKKLAKENNWSLVVIDGNLLKEGEIGGLPTIESYTTTNSNGEKIEKKITVYAVHNKLREIDEEIAKGKSVLLFIDEINRCEHTVQQELMNLILNREINGYKLHDDVKILAAMNPSSKYGSDFDYQVVDMDAAQENRFVWLNMEPDYNQWLNWAMDSGIEQKVIEFISTFPEYLHRINEDDVRATPRSYERVSKKEKYYLFSEAIRNRCAWCNGAGTVCIASDRYDHQHTRRTAWYRNPCNSRRLCERSNRSCDGNLDRSSTSVSATCIVFTGGSRNGSK